jgi:UDP:flavonoid glycosyltransferase YjiC (YdhE family)
MRVAVAFAPGAGHLQAVLPVYEALRADGYEAALCGSPDLARDVTIGGNHLGVLPTGYHRYQRTRLSPASPAYTRANEQVIIEMAAGSYRDLHCLMSRWRPDLVVRDTSERGASLAAHQLGIPVASIVSCADAPLQSQRRAEERYASLTRTTLQLAPPTGPVTLDAQLVGLRPARFFGETADLDPLTTFRYRPARTRHPPAIPRRGRSRDRRALVALGTFITEPGISFYRTITTGLRNCGIDHITVKIRNDELRRQLAALCPEISVHEHVDLLTELSQCAVVVCHGSANSTMEALYYRALPLVIPFHNDAFHVAARCSQQRLALSIPPATVSVDTVTATVSCLQHDEQISDAVEQFGRENQALPDDAALIDSLRRLTRT